tara:strand:+ start:810 stop:1103 length:294 start_codon:yes stop_codon:yes gene_type:complete
MITKQLNKKSEENMIYQLQQLIYEFTMKAIKDDYNWNVEGDKSTHNGLSLNYVDADARIDFSNQVGGSNFSTLDGVLTEDQYYEIWDTIIDDYFASC